jgi:hypothetical protein
MENARNSMDTGRMGIWIWEFKIKFQWGNGKSDTDYEKQGKALAKNI